MGNITMQELALRQPSFPETTETDAYYLALANALYKKVRETRFGADMPDGVSRRVALTLTDYMRDIVSDAGIWRSFVDANRELYGWSVPFHEIPEDYIDYELNREDVRFLVWYAIAMLWEERRHIYPHDATLLALADQCYDILDAEYEDSPVHEEFNISRGLEFNDPEDHKEIYRLGNWLFLHSYLLTPAYSLSLRDILMSENHDDPDYESKMNKRLEDAMMQDPTGPLALYTPEWVYLMLERKLPHDKPVTDAKIHPYYEAFTKFTGGEEIRFFDSYESMNRFFIEALGWAEGEEHLSQAKGARDYILMVSKHKGMLMARDIARCIKAPSNPMYDEAYARRNAFMLLSERGCCPGDLLRFIFRNEWLPDAAFPGTDNRRLVHDNRDFIARCYLQLYYRGD